LVRPNEPPLVLDDPGSGRRARPDFGPPRRGPGVEGVTQSLDRRHQRLVQNSQNSWSLIAAKIVFRSSVVRSLSRRNGRSLRRLCTGYGGAFRLEVAERLQEELAEGIRLRTVVTEGERRRLRNPLDKAATGLLCLGEPDLVAADLHVPGIVEAAVRTVSRASRTLQMHPTLVTSVD